ncbi:MAG TPA: VOC family protein [Bacteroidia bacterium]|nr:VOC family protein [Bacteroidia bacterium]
MDNNLYPCLWFDGKAKEAAEFYCDTFPNTKITSTNPMVTMLEIFGQSIMCLNGGPQFTPNPSVSFFINCNSKEETDQIWHKLTMNAKILMPLNNYEWSEYYGFLQDKFGFSWQIMTGDFGKNDQKLVPCFLFTDNKFGQAHDAISFYTKVFSNSKIVSESFYTEKEMPQKGIVKHATIILDGHEFRAMDGHGNHNFTFNEAISFVINCDNQTQIDFFWNTFTSDGGQESRCGWCKDKFGVSWQVVPSMLGKLMSHPEKGQQVMEAFLKMKKFDIEVLMNICYP